MLCGWPQKFRIGFRMTNQRQIIDLAALIIEDWECAMSDSGFVWDKARRALTLALVGVTDTVRVDAYALAYRMTLNREK